MIASGYCQLQKNAEGENINKESHPQQIKTKDNSSPVQNYEWQVNQTVN
jgi:hypothetical protein